MSRRLAREWAASAGQILATKNPTGECKHWMYLVVSGRAVDQFDAGIWKDEHGTTFDGSLGSRSRSREDAATDQSFGRIEFCPQADGTVRAVLSGTVIAAYRTQARLMPWPSQPDGRGYLSLGRPGRSQLRVFTLVPAGAKQLEIHVKHMVSARYILPGHGQVAFRLGVDGMPWESNSEACSGTFPDDVDEWTVPARFLAGRDELHLVLDYRHGNTTYRVVQLELLWDLSGG